MAGWNRWANRNEKPQSSITRATCAPPMQVRAQRFEQVRTAALRGGGAVAVLGHARPRACGHQARCGGDVERVDAVPAGAADVDDVGSRDLLRVAFHHAETGSDHLR
jgi:hypothetical protein